MYKVISLSVAVLIILNASFAFGQDFLPRRYHTYQEVLDTLTDLRNSFPEIICLDTMGYSTRDSIPMLRVKISDNPQVDEDEPAVFFCGGVHADEVLSVEVVLNLIQNIIDRYSRNDASIQRYIKALEIFVVPFINPEGHLVVENGDLDWRKNKSDNDTNGVFDNYDGVDNNRNYDIGWEYLNSNNSANPTNLMFRGYAPFTELENQAMRDFSWKYRPVIALDYHSPTYGQPEVVYFPWEWTYGGHGNCPDYSLMREICTNFCSRILKDNGYETYDYLYGLVNKGDFKTYFYGNFGTVAFTVEISDTTIQDASLVDAIVAHHLPGQYYLLDRALRSGITGVIRDSITLEPLEAEVQVLGYHNPDINPRLSRPDFGRFRRLLAPGEYSLRFIKTGYEIKRICDVPVNSSCLTSSNVLLCPLNPRPPAPELFYPCDGDTIYADTVRFWWSAPVYSQRYQLEVADNSNFESYIICDSNLFVNEYAVPRPSLNDKYCWRVKAGNENGWGPYSETYFFIINIQSGIDLNRFLPAQFINCQNYPNPFNGYTNFSFYLPAESFVKIEIFNITGALVAKPINNMHTKGWHIVSWDGVDLDNNQLASGIYFYRLNAGNLSTFKKMVILK